MPRWDVLVREDGKRWVTDLDGVVDLSTIPVAIIERIDVLKDGASAVYGSDAVAGVIADWLIEQGLN